MFILLVARSGKYLHGSNIKKRVPALGRLERVIYYMYKVFSCEDQKASVILK